MKRDGFSLTEVLLTVFAVAAVATVLFPLNLIDVHQAERIARWKTFYPELLYSFELMKINEKSLIEQYQNNTDYNSDYFFEIFTKYLNIDKKKTLSENYKKYRIYFLNGKVIKRYSRYDADFFVTLKNGMIAGYSDFDRNPNNVKNAPLGVMFVDVNGSSKKRNFVGRDVFGVFIYPDKIEPLGYNASRQEMKEDCSPVGSGLKCAAYYLVGGDF